MLSSTRCKAYGPYEWPSRLHQASLSREEYNNPFLVFERAFKEKTLEEFEFFLWEIVHLSLSPCTEEFQYDLVTPYLQFNKNAGCCTTDV